MRLDDFREMARWTPAEHRHIGFVDTMDAVNGTLHELDALLLEIPDACPLRAKLLRIKQQTAVALADAQKRFAMAYPEEIGT